MPITDEQLEQILNGIKMQESSGGINKDHPTITREGIMQGQSASGSYGMMTPTASDTFKKHPELQQQYPDVAEKLQDYDSNQPFIKEHFNKDENLAHDTSAAAFKDFYQGLGNEDAAKYAYFNGKKAALKKLAEPGGMEEIKNHFYVKGVNEKQNLKPFPNTDERLAHPNLQKYLEELLKEK